MKTGCNGPLVCVIFLLYYPFIFNEPRHHHSLRRWFSRSLLHESRTHSLRCTARMSAEKNIYTFQRGYLLWHKDNSQYIILYFGFATIYLCKDQRNSLRRHSLCKVGGLLKWNYCLNRNTSVNTWTAPPNTLILSTNLILKVSGRGSFGSLSVSNRHKDGIKMCAVD